MAIEQETETVVNAMSRLITSTLRAYENESRSPGFDADRMDERLKGTKEIAEKLNAMRDEFERLMAGAYHVI